MIRAISPAVFAAPASAVVILLGGPCSGKSSLATALARASRPFSVRKHFEPLRMSGVALPPLGTLLSDDLVWEAMSAGLRQPHAILEGVPGTEGQARRLLRWSDATKQALLPVWVLLSPADARQRALARRVCVTCDGGVDDASEDDSGAACRNCGGAIAPRADEREGIVERLRSWRMRRRVLLKLLPPLAVVSGAYARQVSEYAKTLHEAHDSPMEIIQEMLRRKSLSAPRYDPSLARRQT